MFPRKDKLIVVKVGTNVLTNRDKRLSGPVMKELVRQMAALYERGIITVLVSSGGAIAGKEILSDIGIADKYIRQQVFCAVGQPRLMRLYYNHFHHFGMRCAQVLATKKDFSPGEHRENMINCYEGLISQGIIPIANEDDATSLQMSMFTDNDELASLIAEMLNADQLILLTDKEGLYNGNPEDEDTEKLNKVKSDEEVEHFVQSSNKKEGEGRGGMITKLKVAKNTAAKGIPTTMAKGKRNNIIIDIVDGKEVGTKFIP